MRISTCVFLLCLVLAGCASAVQTLAFSDGTAVSDPVRWNGTVSLADGAIFDIPAANDPNVTFTINRTSALGALDAAATDGGFGYTVTSTTWGPFVDSIGGVAYNATSWDSWLYQVNGVTAGVGAADYALADGDVVTFWYGAWNSDPATARDLIEITVSITEPAPAPVRWNGTVSLADGATFNIPAANDPNVTFTINRTSALGALDAAATAGGFNYSVKSSDWGPFIDSIGGVAYNATSWDSWLYQVNGATADVGAAGYTLSDGDVVTYWYGAWGSTPGAARDLVTITATVTAPPTPTATPTVTVTTTPDTGGPFGGTHVPSTRIEAEDFDTGGEGVAYHDLEPANLGGAYRPAEGVDVETVGSVTNVAYVRAGEYLKYSIDTTIAGNFTLVLHAANPEATVKAVRVYLDGVPAGEVLIGGTGGWTTYQDFTGSSPLTIPTGRHVVTLAFEGINRVNLDWLSLAAGTVPTTTVPSSAVPTFQTVQYGPGNIVPGRVQAENFDQSGTAAAYSDTTAVNEGGVYRTAEPVDIEYTAGETSYNVGWIRTGEWLVYTVNVASAGQYTASFRAANPDASNKGIDVYVDGTKVGTVQISGTGSFGTYRTFTFPVALPAGTHQLKLVFPSQRLNLNYVEFVQGTTVTSTTTEPALSGTASFTAAPNPVAKSAMIRFTLTPAAGKTVKSVWWTFDKDDHYGTWNSRNLNPGFYYPKTGTYTPLVKITYTDGTIETVERVDYVRAT